MIAGRRTSITLAIMSVFLVLGCAREKPKNDFELGQGYFRACNYKSAMIRLESWIRQNPNNVKGHNTEAHAMLAVMYHDDETRQALFEAELKKLQEMGDPGMVAVLKLVENKTTESRLGNTIENILVKAGELSVDPLIKDLRGHNPRLRKYAQGVLIKVGAPAVEPLIGVLNDPNIYIRSMSVEALSEIGDKRAIEPLKQRLNDPSKLIQVTVVAALHKMGQMNPTEEIILRALEDENVVTRRAAAKACEIIDDVPLISLLKAMKDADADVRNCAALAIGKTRSPEAVQPLLKVLEEDKDEQVRSSAGQSLEKIGKPAVELLIKLLEGSKDELLTIRLVQILGNIKDKRAWESLEKVYKEADNPLLKDETAKALNKLDFGQSH